MKSVRDIISVTITLVLLSFIGISLVRLGYFFLHSQNLL